MNQCCLHDSFFANFQAARDGAVLYVQSVDLTIHCCRFLSISSTKDASLKILESSTIITNSYFERCLSFAYGQDMGRNAIYCQYGSFFMNDTSTYLCGDNYQTNGDSSMRIDQALTKIYHYNGSNNCGCY